MKTKEINLKEKFQKTFIETYKEVNGFNEKVKCFKDNKKVFETLKKVATSTIENFNDFRNEINIEYIFDIDFNERLISIRVNSSIVEKIDELKPITTIGGSWLSYSFGIALYKVLGVKPLGSSYYSNSVYFDLNTHYLEFHNFYIME